MEYLTKEIKLKNNKTYIFRQIQENDAEKLMVFMKQVLSETNNLSRLPDEITLEGEKKYVNDHIDNKNGITILVEKDNKFVGSCNFEKKTGCKKISHKCSFGICLLQEVCGQGIGTRLFEELIKYAKEYSCEQAELSVVTTNLPAINLYIKMGFKIAGTMPKSMKNEDGTYIDTYIMYLDLSE